MLHPMKLAIRWTVLLSICLIRGLWGSHLRDTLSKAPETSGRRRLGKMRMTRSVILPARKMWDGCREIRNKSRGTCNKCVSKHFGNESAMSIDCFGGCDYTN